MRPLPDDATLDSLLTLKDFYNFFAAIPEEAWLEGAFVDFIDQTKCCAQGHLGMRDNPNEFKGRKGPLNSQATERAVLRLIGLFRAKWGSYWAENYTVIDINDGLCKMFPQNTPKDRILAACSE